MTKGAFFLDRDGTIIVDTGYLSDPRKVKLLPGAAEAIHAINEAGYLVIIVSNQSGIARGMFDEAALELVNQEMYRQLAQVGAHVDAFYYCPHLKSGSVPAYAIDCDCRKPKNGLFLRAIADYRLEPARCFGCGDRVRDVENLPQLGIPRSHLGVLAEQDAFPAYNSLLSFVRASLKENADQK